MSRRIFSVLLTLSLSLLLFVVSLHVARVQARPGTAPGDVIISEVAWAGTAASGFDEWIELHNTTGSAVDLSGWALTDSSGDLSITLGGTLPAGGFFLLERTDDTTVSDIPADQIYTGGLNNTGESLTLRDGTSAVIDTANGDGGGWPAGSGSPAYHSMERSSPAAPDTDGNWVGNDGVTRNGLDADGNPLNGTPRQPNSPWSGQDLPDLAVAKQGPAAAVAGDPLVYEITVANEGDVTATASLLTDTLPVALTYAGDDSGLPVTVMPPYLVWQAGDVAAGVSLTFRLTTTIDVAATGTVTNTIEARTPLTESVTANNTATAATTIVSATGGLVINEIHADPDAAAGDANGDGTVDTGDDEFLEVVNNSGADVDLSGWSLADGVGTRHVFPAGTVLPQGCAVVVFGGGAPVGGGFGESIIQTASSGSLGFNNGGDAVSLLDTGGASAAAYTYGSEGGDDQSLTRDPDIIGPEPLIKHTVATGAGGALFSPGTRIDGSPFAPDCSPDTPVVAIPAIQGAGVTSTLAGQVVETTGIVVGLFEGNRSGGDLFNGFFLQDPAGDGDPATSDGLFVNLGTAAVGVAAGDRVSVTGVVGEFSEYDGAACAGIECLTQLGVTNLGSIYVNGAGAVTATPIDPPLDDPERSYYEAREGMLVTLPVTGVVVGPTSFGTAHVVRSDLGVARVLRPTPYAGMPVGVRHYERYGEVDGDDPPNLIVGSVVDDVDGPLAFSYGSYLVATQPGQPWTVMAAQPAPDEAPTWPEAGAGAFSAATFNTLNFEEPFGTKMEKVVAAITNMGCPTFLALEEIDVALVINQLLSELGNAGCPYGYGFSHPDVGGHGVALLWRTDRVTAADWSTAFQGCSADGSSSSTYDPLWDYCRSMGQYPLFSRRPVVMTATVALSNTTTEMVVVANHFKSQLGGAAADRRRLEQAQFVAALVDEFAAGGTPRVLVMGDLNDYEASPPLQALYAGGTLTNTWYTLPAAARYSFIFRGVSQALDHVLVTPALATWLADVGPLHIDADFPYFPYTGDETVVWRVSDHDPVVATFVYKQPETAVFLPLVLKP